MGYWIVYNQKNLSQQWQISTPRISDAIEKISQRTKLDSLDAEWIGDEGRGKVTNYINPRVYDVQYQLALKNKMWGEKFIRNGDMGASEMTKRAAIRYVHLSVKRLAMEGYQYFYMRSHARQGVYDIDPSARDEWTRITGKAPKMRQG